MGAPAVVAVVVPGGGAAMVVRRGAGGEVEELEVNPLDVLGSEVEAEVGDVARQRPGKVIGGRGRHWGLLQPLVERRRERHG